MPVKQPRAELAADSTPGGEDSDTEIVDWTLSLSLLPDSATHVPGQPPEPPHATGDESGLGTITPSSLTDVDTVETKDTSDSGPSDTGAIDAGPVHPDPVVVRVRRWLATRRGMLVAALALLTVSLVGVGGICIAQVGQDHDLDSMRSSAIAAAERQTMNLMNVNSANVGAQLDAIRNGTTGDFQRQLVGVLGTFSTVIQQGKIEATATVAKAGVTAMTSDSAKVLLAVSGAVANAESPQPQSRRYRIGVDLKYSDGNWLVSGMEFIP